jgi:Ni,Fe-hydrogenase I cytochrome b subunit
MSIPDGPPLQAAPPALVVETSRAGFYIVYRPRIWVRVTHWINLLCMTALLMSGLQIFNAHPALY